MDLMVSCPGCFGEVPRRTWNITLNLFQRGGELFQITPMETSSGIQPVEPGSKKKKKIKRGRGKKSKGKRYVIDVRKHKIKTDLFSLPHGAHWLL